MKNIEFYSTMNPDLAFIISFEDEYYEEGKALALEGWQAWCFGDEATEHLSEEEVKDIHDNWGYDEASSYLLSLAGIPHLIQDEWLTEDGELLPEYENEDVEFVSCYGD